MADSSPYIRITSACNREQNGHWKHVADVARQIVYDAAVSQKEARHGDQ